MDLTSLGFPLWLRLTHYTNVLFIGLLIRSGIEILGAHPRLYWNDGCTPRTEWLKFTRRQVPTEGDVIYTARDDEIAIHPLLALPYDPLQQLTYAFVVFVLGPLMLLTGMAMSPAIAASAPWYIKLFGGRQVARSLHFLGLAAFALFTVMHTALVLLVHFRANIASIVLGGPSENFVLALIVAIAPPCCLCSASTSGPRGIRCATSARFRSLSTRSRRRSGWWRCTT